MARLITREDFEAEAAIIAEAERINRLSIEEVQQELCELGLRHELPKYTEEEIYRNLLKDYKAQLQIISRNTD